MYSVIVWELISRSVVTKECDGTERPANEKADEVNCSFHDDKSNYFLKQMQPDQFNYNC